jgi:hypothetical protein
MAAGTKVQLRLGGRVVGEVTFHDGELRIGEHVLTISAEGEEDAPVSRTGESDAGNAGAFMAPELPRSRAAVRRPAISLDLPDPEGRFEIREEELLAGQRLDAASVLPRSSEYDISGSDSATSPPLTSAELAGETTLFDFAASHDHGFSEPSLTRAPLRAKEPPAQAAEAAGPLYAGLMVERAGKVERVMPFRGSVLVAGRSPTCDLVPPLDQVVRRTAAAASAGRAGHPTALPSAAFASMPERDLVTESDDEDDFWDLEKELEVTSGTARLSAGRPSRSAGTDIVVEVVLGSEGLPAELRAVLREMRTREQRLPAELRIRRRP